MKKKILTLFLGVMCFGHANATAKYMTILLNNGTQQSFVLNDEPTISFDNYYMNVNFAETSGKNLIAIRKDDIKSYHYSESPTGINAVSDKKYEISIEDKCVKISGARGLISLYTSNGQCVYSTNISEWGTVNINLSNYNTGVFLLNINGNTIKITNN